jgi:hypothetical protein
MTEDIPDGMNAKQWRYYQLGQKARADELGRESANVVFSTADRSWFLAGWHDQDITINQQSN